MDETPEERRDRRFHISSAGWWKDRALVAEARLVYAEARIAELEADLAPRSGKEKEEGRHGS